jgi:vitamin B12 transporter
MKGFGHHRTLSYILITLGVTSTIPLTTHAEEKEIVVSASRIPIPYQQVGSSTTILTEKDFKRTRASTVGEMLRQVPSVAVDRSGSFGAFTQVRIRGAEANQTLVIIDGIEMNDPSGASDFNFANLLLADISKIEILRGPQSALWGSDAIGGVIMITTKSGTGKPTTGLQFSGGSYKTFLGSISHRGQNGAWKYALGATRLQSDGFSTASEARGNTEKDAHNTNSYHFKLGFQPNRQLDLGFVVRRVDNETETDGFVGGVGAVDNDTETRGEQIFGRLHLKYSSRDRRWTHQFGYGVNETDRNNLTSGAMTSFAIGKKSKADYQISYQLKPGNKLRHRLIAALEHEKEEMDSTFSGGHREIKNNSYVLEYRLDINKRWFASLAYRYDDNDIFRNAHTERATLARLFPKSDLKLRASWGTGNKNPTLTELFGFFPNFTGNPNLQPESSEGLDLGVEKYFWQRRLYTELNFFSQRTTNAITGFGNTAINLPGESKADGVELFARWKINEHWTLDGGFTYLDAEAADGDHLVRRPRQKATLGLLHKPNKRLSWYLFTVHKRNHYDFQFDAMFNSTIVPLPDYTVVNWVGSYQLNRKTKLIAKAVNLFDEEYEDVLTYGTSGRAAYIGVQVNL